MTPNLERHLANCLRERVFRGTAHRLVWSLVEAMEADWGEQIARAMVNRVHEDTDALTFHNASQLLHFLAPLIAQGQFAIGDKDDDGGPAAVQ